MNSNKMPDYKKALYEIVQFKKQQKEEFTEFSWKHRYYTGYNMALWLRGWEDGVHSDNPNVCPESPFTVETHPGCEWWLPCPNIVFANTMQKLIEDPKYDYHREMSVVKPANTPIPITAKGLSKQDLWDAIYGTRPKKTYYLQKNGSKKWIDCPFVCSLTKHVLRDLEDLHDFTSKYAKRNGLFDKVYWPPTAHGTLPEPVPGWFDLLQSGFMPEKWVGGVNVRYAESENGYISNAEFDAVVEDWRGCSVAARKAHPLPKAYTHSLVE